MTVKCRICRNTPSTYININGYDLCMKCVDIQYEIELKKLKGKYGK